MNPERWEIRLTAGGFTFSGFPSEVSGALGVKPVRPVSLISSASSCMPFAVHRIVPNVEAED